jgi:CheY-like chemotaxis protein
MPQLSEPFPRIAAARARSRLGLTRRPVEVHGGSIAASGAGPGQGGEFTARLPRAPADAPGDLHALRVLIADDNVDAADSMAMLLQLDGCDVRTAHDGEAAVREAAEFRPRVVFLDLGMPGVDGFEACRRIRAEPWGRAMTLVALTGWGQDRDRARCVEAGFDHHVTKPADSQIVSELLAAARDRR